MASREVVVRLQLDDKDSVSKFQALRKEQAQLEIDFAATKKAIRDNAKELIGLNEAYAKGAIDAEQLAAKIGVNRQQFDGLTKTLADQDVALTNVRGQTREYRNDLSGLTDAGLRFRDKMADANLVALKNAGILGQLDARSASLTQEMTALSVAFAKGTTTEKEYKDGTARLQKELDATNTKSAALEKKIEELNLEFKAGKISQDEYKAGIASVGKSTEELGSKFDKFVAGQAGQLKSTLSSVALQYVGVGAAVYGLQKIVGGAIDIVVEFDRKLANVSALGGEYRANIDALGESAKNIGPKFGVGAGKALDSVEALAKAGVGASDILGGALEGALTLAASGELDAGQAAEYAASTMVQFGLAGKDVSHIADLLSASANKAQGEVSDFGNALKFVGPVAASMNVSLDETVGTLATFAQNGILGEMSGTSLRGVLASLTSPSKQATDELRKLGIVTEDGSNKLFDAQGKFLGLANLAGQLSEATANLTDEQKANALGVIFGNRGVTAANILIKEGAAGVEDWTNKVNDSGIAARVAADKLNSLSGQADKLASSWERFVLSVENGKGPIGLSVQAIQASLAGLFDSLSNIAEGSDNAFVKIARMLSAFGPVGAVMEGAQTRIDAYTKAAREAEVQVEALGKATITSFGEGLKKFGSATNELGFVKDQVRAINDELNAVGEDKAGLNALRLKFLAQAQEYKDGTLAKAVALANLEQVQKRFAALEAKSNEVTKEAVTVTEDDTVATEDNTKAKTAQKVAIENAVGSIADYNAQIADLKKLQSQSTTSEQFNAYTVQIDALTEKVQFLTGELVKMPALKDVQFTATGTDTGPIQAPPAQEKVSQLADLEEQQRINEIKRITDYNLQRQILNEQYNEGVIQSKEELNARLQVLADEEAQQQAQRDANTAAATAQLFDTLQAISDQSFDKKIADVDSQEQTLKDRLANARSEQEKAEIQGQIDRLENEKKSLEKRKASFKAFAIASSLISTYLAAEQVLADPTNFTPVGKIIAAAGIVAAGLANVAKIAGFAEGGTVPDQRGTVTSSWGKPIRRSNGDDVLVTLKRKEKVLNADQIARAEAIAGKGFWGRIGLPNHPTYASTTAFLADQQAPRKQRIAGYAIGGTVGYIASPTVAELSTERNVAELRAINFQPVVSVVEINKVQNRTRVAESLGTA